MVMQRYAILTILCCLCLPSPCTAQVVRTIDQFRGLPTRIAFGSCANQERSQPILDVARNYSPQLFIYLGDNIYGDTFDMEVLQTKYRQLWSKPEFQRLREEVTVLSVWDDHDYGADDAGAEYPMKTQSRAIFLDFWHVPDQSPRRQRPGIYGAHRFQAGNKILQIILLDTRSFRSPLEQNPEELPLGSVYKNAYRPINDTERTMLGAAQWTWLEQQFRKPADIRIVASSIQFAHSYNGWESWNNLPNEQQRMLNLIQATNANGVIFISGDVHWGEISRRPVPDGYPILDVTASGLTEDWHTIEPNHYRVESPVAENHFGMIDIDWERRRATLMIIDVQARTRIHHSVPLSVLRSKKANTADNSSPTS